MRQPVTRIEHAAPPGQATRQTFFAQAEETTGFGLPKLVRDEFARHHCLDPMFAPGRYCSD